MPHLSNDPPLQLPIVQSVEILRMLLRHSFLDNILEVNFYFDTSIDTYELLYY